MKVYPKIEKEQEQFHFIIYDKDNNILKQQAFLTDGNIIIEYDGLEYVYDRSLDLFTVTYDSLVKKFN